MLYTTTNLAVLGIGMFIIGFALGRILKLSKTKVDDDKETLKAIDSIRNDPNDNEWRKA